MYLKIMSGESAPDSDARKTFRLLADVTKVQFDRTVAPKDEKKPENRLVANRGPKIEVYFKTGPMEIYWPEGNCYLMNKKGKTIASFGVMPYAHSRANVS